MRLPRRRVIHALRDPRRLQRHEAHAVAPELGRELAAQRLDRLERDLGPADVVIARRVAVATESENRETRAQDESIKNLPKGQMEILMSDDTHGTLHSLLQVRSPVDVSIPDFAPALYPRMLQSRGDSSGANLRFKDPELERKYRVPNRYAGGFRK